MAMAERSFDPVTFEVITHKMWQILKEAGYALVHVTGSPVVTDVGEHMESFYDRDGNSALAGGGISSHIMSGSFAIKHIIREYEENPGIHEGDQFFLNDPYIASLHNADMFVMAPIFYQGERVGWTACATHTVECGGINPGGMSPSAKEIYHDGLRFAGIKLVEGGNLRKDVLNAIKNMVRVPDLVALDTVAKIAGCNVAATKLLMLVERYGKETVTDIFQDLIRVSEAKARARLRELPNGTWRARTYIDGDGQSEEIYRVLLTMTKEDDHLVFDFTGTDPQSPGCINTSANGTLSGLFTPVVSLLFHNIEWNQGLIAPLEMVLPEGTLVNPTHPASVTGGVPGGACFAVTDVATQTICKLFAASRHREDASTQWRAGSGNCNLSGRNQYGQPSSTLISDGMAGGTGAGVNRDGCDTGGIMVNPQAIIANVETFERIYPLRWLFRKQAVDTAGHGKFRGGLGGETGLVLHEANGPQHQVFFGRGKDPALVQGIFGGYPANNTWTIIVRDGGLEEFLRKGNNPAPEPQELPGEVWYLPTKIGRLFAPTDVHYHVWEGGGGYGDPLDREPALVSKDVLHRLISIGCARDIYGVVLEGPAAQVDETATDQLRQRYRKERLSSRETVWPESRTEKASPEASVGTSEEKTRMTEYLEIAGDTIRCMNCGDSVSPASRNYKEFVPRRERPLTVAGAWRSPTKEFVLREFYCPGCGTMLDVEMTRAGDPILWDVFIRPS
jgi:N-methylhydantoinase B